MSNPKKKARDLVKKYFKGKDEHGWFLCEFESCAKQCALVAVDEMINEYQSMSDLESVLVVNNEITFVVDKLKYLQQVKNEINKL